MNYVNSGALQAFVGWFDTGADTADEIRYQLAESVKASKVGDEPHEYEDALLGLSDVDLIAAFEHSRG